MATSASPASSREFFQSHGFYLLDDEAIGQKVQEVDAQGLSTNVKSWEYFKDIVDRHPGPRDILTRFLEHPNPQRCHTFGPEPGQIFCVWPQPQQSHRLVVAMWSAGAEMEFYDGSHIGALVTVPSSNGMFEASPQAVRNQPMPFRLEKGGMAILDLRMLFQRKAGFVIAYGMDIPLDKQPKDEE